MGESETTAEPVMTLREFRSLTITPAEAVAKLSEYLSDYDAMAEIKDRLESGLLRAFAEITISTYRGRADHSNFQMLTSTFWRRAELAFQSSFWTRGADEVEMGSGTNVQAFGIRFTTVDVESLAETFKPSKAATAVEHPEPKPTQEKRRPIAPTELRRFGDLMCAAYPDVTEALAVRIVRAMFPDSAISREQIRALLPPRRPGRPATRG